MRRIKWLLLGIAAFSGMNAFWTAYYSGSIVMWLLFGAGILLIIYGVTDTHEQKDDEDGSNQ